MNTQPSLRPSCLRFVIAEDDHDLRFIITHILAEVFPAAQVAAFANGQDALQDFDENGAHLVVSNHSMPIMDGPTFVRYLRERSSDLPILMVSGSPEAQDEGAAAGISSFLDKDEIMPRLAPMVCALLQASPSGSRLSKTYRASPKPARETLSEPRVVRT